MQTSHMSLSRFDEQSPGGAEHQGQCDPQKQNTLRTFCSTYARSTNKREPITTLLRKAPKVLQQTTTFFLISKFQQVQCIHHVANQEFQCWVKVVTTKPKQWKLDPACSWNLFNLSEDYKRIKRRASSGNCSFVNTINLSTMVQQPEQSIKEAIQVIQETRTHCFHRVQQMALKGIWSEVRLRNTPIIQDTEHLFLTIVWIEISKVFDPKLQ